MVKKTKYPVLVVEFDEPRYGYWNYGKKSGGEFEPECYGADDSYFAGTSGKKHEK